MFCVNCGSENNDNVEICANCGKSTAGKVFNNQTKSSGYLLTMFTAKLFTLYFEIVLWVILAIGIIAGGIIGNLFRTAFLGIIIGGAFSFIQIILIGGLVSLFIKLVNNTEDLKRKIK